MRLYCCYTPSHERLFREVFKPSVPQGFELTAHRLELQGRALFLSPEFLEGIRAKVRLIAQSLRDHPGEVLVWSDVDVLFLDFTPGMARGLLQDSGNDLLFQRSTRTGPTLNSGFFICLSTPEMAALFQSTLERIEREPHRNEESVLNEVLPGSPLPWGYLPPPFMSAPWAGLPPATWRFTMPLPS